MTSISNEQETNEIHGRTVAVHTGSVQTPVDLAVVKLNSGIRGQNGALQTHTQPFTLKLATNVTSTDLHVDGLYSKTNSLVKVVDDVLLIDATRQRGLEVLKRCVGAINVDHNKRSVRSINRQLLD
jgi:hypothetical protein